MARPSKTQIRENRQAWVESLRYGGYTQATGTLRRKHEDGFYSYCCLGVACNVYMKRTGKGSWEDLGFQDSSKFDQGDGDYGIATPPEAVDDYFGLSQYHRQESISDSVSSWCVSMNDDRHQSFETIADFVDGLE